MNDIRKLDLNLLKAFDALMRHRHVSRAAAEIGLGQSGMSQALGRLRLAFADPLFTRSPRGMMPTKRAEEIAPTVHAALSMLAQALAPHPEFDPTARPFPFTIGLSDYLEALILPAAVRALDATGAKVALKVAQLDLVDVLRELDTSRIDLAVGQFTRARTWHRREPLFRDRRVCLFGAGTMPPEPSLDDYLRRRHVLRSIGRRPRSPVDDALREIGFERDVALVVPRFSILPEIVAGSGYIATLPATLAHGFAARSPSISVAELPFAVPPIEVSILWHTNSETDPAHLWMREIVRAAAAQHPLLG